MVSALNQGVAEKIDTSYMYQTAGQAWIQCSRDLKFSLTETKLLLSNTRAQQRKVEQTSILILVHWHKAHKVYVRIKE